MNAATRAGMASVLVLMALAGCTGSFDIDQTEPFRIQLDGAPQTVVVREGAEPREVNVQTCPEEQDPCDVQDVDVKVEVQKTSAEACSILVTIKTPSGEILDQVTIDVGGAEDDDDGDDSDDGNTTDDNATDDGNTTAPTGGTTSNVVVQNLVVNVKGNKNVIVVTQALQGDANVNIQAIKASGNADVDATQDSTTTMTNTTTATTTTGPY